MFTLNSTVVETIYDANQKRREERSPALIVEVLFSEMR
jgi:hypothetical protein